MTTRPLELAERIAAGGTVQELTTPTRSLRANHVYRISTATGTRILKIYGSPARERREMHALDALAGIDGLPVVLDRGTDDGVAWALFEDAGRWNLGTLPENPGSARRAGEILRGVHESATSALSNLSRGIDQEWIAVDFASTLRRLDRYRGRIGVPADLIAEATGVAPPLASEPRPAHTNPSPAEFLVDDEGRVTLVDWEWATLAPPQWDLSKAVWLLGRAAGPGAAAALQEGYGAALSPDQLDRWVVYHAAMDLVDEAERRLAGSSSRPYEDMIDELRRAVAGARSA